MFDEHFTPTQAYAKASEFLEVPTDKPEASTFDPQVSTSDPQALAMMSISHEYLFPRDLEMHTWFANSGDSHHVTSNSSYLHTKKPYSGNC